MKQNKEIEKLHIFTRDGKTFTFLHVGDLTTNESTVSFSYIAQSDDNVKNATFYVQSIAGWSITA